MRVLVPEHGIQDIQKEKKNIKKKEKKKTKAIQERPRTISTTPLAIEISTS